MKNLFSIILILSLFSFVSCKKDDAAEPSAKMELGVFKITQDSATGKTSRTQAVATIWMWNTENRELDVAASGSEIYLGRIYDKTTKTYVSSEFGAIGTSMIETIKPGNYLIYVMLNKSDLPGSQAYSYTTVQVSDDQKLSFKKIFSLNVGTQQYEPWEKNL